MYHAGEGHHALEVRCPAAPFETHAPVDDIVRRADGRHGGAAGPQEPTRAMECWALASLADALAALAEAERAVMEAATEQELGVPCVALGALQARVERCQGATSAARRELAALRGALCTTSGTGPAGAPAAAPETLSATASRVGQGGGADGSYEGTGGSRPPMR